MEIYLHPELRQADSSNEKRPGYSRRYDIYALGVLLFELGVWRTVDQVIKDHNNISAGDFKKRLVDRATKDLPFYFGDRYRDIVVWCLTCGGEGVNEADVSLEMMYWSIVLELSKCP
jgi:hypothetical protein